MSANKVRKGRERERGRREGGREREREREIHVHVHCKFLYCNRDTYSLCCVYKSCKTMNVHLIAVWIYISTCTYTCSF